METMKGYIYIYIYIYIILCPVLKKLNAFEMKMSPYPREIAHGSSQNATTKYLILSLVVSMDTYLIVRWHD